MSFNIIRKSQKILGLRQDGVHGNDTHQAIKKLVSGNANAGKKRNRTVIITAGHGGRDMGAVAADGTTEHEIACDFRNMIVLYLKEDHGIKAVTDGRSKKNATLRQAIEILRSRLNKGIAIDVHTNSSVHKKARGTEMLAAKRHKAISYDICESIAKDMNIPTRGERGWKPQNSGQHHRLAYVQNGGMVLELFFISNTQELETYRSKKWLVAKGVANAIAKHA